MGSQQLKEKVNQAEVRRFALCWNGPIQITRANAEALRENCIRCHGGFVAHAAAASPGGATDMNCVQCHASVGHGSQR